MTPEERSRAMDGWSATEYDKLGKMIYNGNMAPDEAIRVINEQRAVKTIIDNQHAAALAHVKPAPDLTTTLEQRGKRYGAFSEHARATQALKKSMRDFDPTKWDALSASAKEALEMVAHKIGRILNGDPLYADSWVDIAGYAQLVATALQKNHPEHQ